GRIEFMLAGADASDYEEEVGERKSRSRSEKKSRKLKAGKEFDVEAFIDHIESDKGEHPAVDSRRAEARSTKKKAKRLKKSSRSSESRSDSRRKKSGSKKRR